MKAKTTKERYRCINCGELKHLVIVRGFAKRCEDCRGKHLIKLDVLRKLNRIAVGM